MIWLYREHGGGRVSKTACSKSPQMWGGRIGATQRLVFRGDFVLEYDSCAAW